MGDDERYVLAGQRPWNRAVFDEVVDTVPGRWSFASTTDELDSQLADRPRFAFFLHWSELVPEEVTSSTECVCFHMTDVPFGRGGSPLQNLVLHGLRTTKLTALRMTPDVDAGPVYGQADLDLSGTAESVYLRADALAVPLIRRIALGELRPVDQSGEVTRFSRRNPAESALGDDLGDLDGLYDFVRMLDAEGYPHAFVDVGRFRISLRGANRYLDRVEASAVVTLRDGEDPA